MALFRIVEPVEGTIYIDDIDISQLGLYDLRSRLAFIPEDPVVFSGTLRDNLDPLGSFSVKKVWKALEIVGLKELFVKNEEGLNQEIEGAKLSLSQRQLLYLARCVLKPSSVIILDSGKN